MNEGLGIDRNRLEPTIDLINDNIEVIHEAFGNIKDYIDTAGKYYSGDGYDKFKEKADKYTYNFAVVEGNVQSYKEDLTTFLNNYINYELSYKVEGPNEE